MGSERGRVGLRMWWLGKTRLREKLGEDRLGHV